MWHEAKLALFVVVNGIIVHEKRQSHDNEVCFGLLKEKIAVFFFILNHIVIAANCYPLLAEKKVNVWEIILALCNGVFLGSHLVLVSFCLLKEMFQKVFKVSLRHLNRT